MCPVDGGRSGLSSTRVAGGILIDDVMVRIAVSMLVFFRWLIHVATLCDP